MATRVIDDTKLQNIAVAIQGKDSGGTMTVDEMPTRIADIPTILPIILPKNVNFYDYDGTILYAYTQDEFLALSAMPELPTQNGLICQGWNWSYQDAINYVTEYGILEVGAVYITDNGESRFYMEFSNGARRSLTFNCQVKGGSVYVDWGDGSTLDILTNAGASYVNKSISHTYVDSGNYVMSVSCDDNTKYQFTSAIFNPGGFIALTRAIIGRNVEIIGANSFAKAYLLESVIIPDGVGVLNAFEGCYTLKHITIPNSSTNSNLRFLTNYSLKSVSMSKSVKDIPTQAFDGCLLIKYIAIPDSVTSIATYAFKLFILDTIIIPQSVMSIGLSFTACTGLKYFDISHYNDPDNIPSLTSSSVFNATSSDLQILVKNQEMLDAFSMATNWSAYASKMVIKEVTP